MRLTRLGLHRYGHLADVELAFPPDRGLHIVLGANEAGKSTALAAIGDALFGFPHRTPYAYRFNTGDLRLAFGLSAADGRAAAFVRLKRNKDDLLDANERPQPEAALKSFLGGVTEDAFRRIYGLDAAELRRGGQAMLADDGAAGESILQAQTGLPGFRALVEKLDTEAKKLAGDRRPTRALIAEGERYKSAREDLAKSSVVPADWKAAHAAQADLHSEREKNGQDADRLHAERTRLDRIRRTAPALRARARDLAERAGLGDVASLPPDAEQRRQATTLDRDLAAHNLRRARETAELQDKALAALSVDTALLAEAELIETLSGEQSRVAAAHRARAEEQAKADQSRRAVEDAGRRLGRAEPANSLAARVPDALARDRARRAIDAHARLEERTDAAARAREDAARDAELAQAALIALPPVEPSATLRAAIEAARAEGRLDDELRQAARAAERAEADLAAALAGLPLWSGTADALAAAAMPLEAAQTRAARALQSAEEAAGTARDRLIAAETTLDETRRDLRALAAAGDLPTEAAIGERRARRDRAWRLLRRHYEGGPAPDAAERGDLPEPLAGTVERLIHEADALADRRALESERLAQHTQLQISLARQTEARDAALAAEAAARDAHAAQRAAWRALWQPAGIDADAPEPMRDWRRARQAVLDRRGAALDAAGKLADLRARHHAALARLAPHVPDALGTLADRLRAADWLCKSREDAEAARARAQTRLTDAAAKADKARQASARLDADWQAWRAEWQTAAAGLALSAKAGAEDGRLALDLWNQLETAARDWRDAEARAAAHGRVIDGFAEQAASLVARVAADLADAAPDEAVRALAARLADARTAATERKRIGKELAEARKTIEQADRAHDAAEATLAGLRALAGAVDDDGLLAAIALAARHAELSRRIAERDAELAREDRAPEALERDADGVDLDTLPGRLEAIDARLRDIGADNERISRELTETRARLAAMERGGDAAGAAQRMQDAAAEMEDIAHRYVRLRLAHTLLRAGIDRFRREQQDPLLARAGALFGRLTEGRYVRLGVEDSDKGQPTLVALRPDDSHCPADRLSEGTRDQLYLALRLASIEANATRAEPLPFIADDLLVNFDDARARAALRVLAEFGATTQTILFTHHAHIAAMADPAWASVRHL